MKTTLSMQCGAPYIPIPKGRGFTANPDKAQWYGKVVSTVDRFYPSSQLCSSCGAQWPGTKDLSVREWTCPVCGVVHDRDVNAAKNILSEGLRVLA